VLTSMAYDGTETIRCYGSIGNMELSTDTQQCCVYKYSINLLYYSTYLAISIPRSSPAHDRRKTVEIYVFV
jgi:hypothetical protein